MRNVKNDLSRRFIMLRFITTLFFIMLGFFVGRLTAGEFADAKQEPATSALLEQAYVIIAYPSEDPKQNHQNMILAAAILKKVAAKRVKQPVSTEVPLEIESSEVLN
jgi:hypothetical protein